MPHFKFVNSTPMTAPGYSPLFILAIERPVMGKSKDDKPN